MHAYSVPFFVSHLNALSKILAKAEAYCAERKIAPESLLNFRLYPDMFAFTRQVQIACDHAKGAPARLAGVAVPGFEDSEKTFPELQARIAKTLEFISSLKPAQFDGAEARTITLKVGGQDMSFPAIHYLQGFAMPNFHFHLTAAYAILRHNGLALGKRDYMGLA